MRALQRKLRSGLTLSMTCILLLCGRMSLFLPRKFSQQLARTLIRLSGTLTPTTHEWLLQIIYADPSVFTSAKSSASWRLFPLGKFKASHYDRSNNISCFSGLKSYNVSANREAYNLLKTFINEHSEFNGTILQFENYALEGMKAVDPASTAYPHRDDDILV